MLKIVQTADGRNPFDELDCPLCEKTEFESVDHAAVYCVYCGTKFHIRHTAGDPGYCADAITDTADRSSVLHPQLIGQRLYRIMKTDESDREWLVASTEVGTVNKSYYLRQLELKIGVEPKGDRQHADGH